MGARCCCGKRPEVDNRDLHAQLLKDDRTTASSTVKNESHLHGTSSRSPSITDSSFNDGPRGGNHDHAVDYTTGTIEDDDDPFASPRNFVDENELSFKSGTSHDYDHGHMSSVSSLNGTVAGKEADSYEDSSARFKYSSQKFDKSPSGDGRNGWDI